MASSSSSSPAESRSAFEDRIGDIIKTGSIIPCLAIGSKLGLFEKMAEFREPKTSQQIADATDCKERYVVDVAVFRYLAKLPHLMCYSGYEVFFIFACAYVWDTEYPRT